MIETFKTSTTDNFNRYQYILDVLESRISQQNLRFEGVRQNSQLAINLSTIGIALLTGSFTQSVFDNPDLERLGLSAMFTGFATVFFALMAIRPRSWAEILQIKDVKGHLEDVLNSSDSHYFKWLFNKYTCIIKINEDTLTSKALWGSVSLFMLYFQMILIVITFLWVSLS